MPNEDINIKKMSLIIPFKKTLQNSLGPKISGGRSSFSTGIDSTGRTMSQRGSSF